ncbi:MAG: hypothetical protein PF904_18910 [Kiritimatiellae bacterium]|jgi:hypothetical protein|nr:hypothetical protein [Kiritimatiellia bacterium]
MSKSCFAGLFISSMLVTLPLQSKTVALWKLDYEPTNATLNTQCLIDHANDLTASGALTGAAPAGGWALPPNPDTTVNLLGTPTNNNSVYLTPNDSVPYTSLTSASFGAKVNVTNSFTIEGWLSREANPGTLWHYMAGAHLASGSGRWILSLRNLNGVLTWMIYLQNYGNDMSFPVPESPMTTNQWRHLALTYNRNAGATQQGVWSLFINSQSYGTITNSIRPSAITAADSVFALGGRPNALNMASESLDYWRVSDTVLSTNEFLNANPGSVTSHPAGLVIFLTGQTLSEPDTPLEGVGAELTLQGAFQVDTFTEGALLFLDRTYTIAVSPDWLRGQLFLRSSIDGEISMTVKKSGVLTAITADPNDPVAASYTQSALLESLGFVWTQAPATFQLFGTSSGDISRTYQKQVTAGDMFVFPKWVVLAGFSTAEGPEPPFDTQEGRGELLYNGIELSTNWPPQTVDTADWSPMDVPYLEEPPEQIYIDIGRQLFVDDFLIATTTLQRVYGMPEKYSGNPVLSPETTLELNGNNNDAAVPKSGGLWWDPHEKLFKLWYEAGWIHTICYATSTNGIDWVRPELDVVPGTNQVLPTDLTPDSWTVVPDWTTGDPLQRYKMYMHPPGSSGAICMTSADGIHWVNRVTATASGDRSTMFYNPFREKWIYSLRASWRSRSRDYREHDTFLRGATWETEEAVHWLAADEDDPMDPVIQRTPQLYNFDAVAYESIMLGAFEIHHGPENPDCMAVGLPKITELNFAYSRDGFHWSRPDRRAHIPAERWGSDKWDTGYVQSLGNICTIQDDKLWFYYSGFQGDTNRLSSSWMENGMYDKGAMGIAFLRRDGFVGMTADGTGGELLTHPLLFSGSCLFVNVDCPQGELRVEMQDAETGAAISNFTIADCNPVSTNSTIQRIIWQNETTLKEWRGKPVRFRFSLTNGSLYAFWVSRDESGRSDGYVAGGGPGYTGTRDTVGKEALGVGL